MLEGVPVKPLVVVKPVPKAGPGGASGGGGIGRECGAGSGEWHRRSRAGVGGGRWGWRRSQECFRQSCSRAAAADRVAVGEHHAIACADDCLGIDLIGEADTRSEVLVVVVHRRGAVAGVGASAGELQRAVDAGNRIRQGGIEEAHVVMHFAKRSGRSHSEGQGRGSASSSPSSCPEHRERSHGSASRYSCYEILRESFPCRSDR